MKKLTLFTLITLITLISLSSSFAVRSPGIGADSTVYNYVYNIQDSLGINIKDAAYGAVGDNVTDDKASISLAITAALASGKKIIVPAGTFKISSSLSITCGIQFAEGGMISVDSGQVLTLSGDVQAGRYQIFTGTGTVVISGNNAVVYPEWNGSIPDDSIDDTDTLQALINSLPNGGTISFGAGDYEVSAIVSMVNNISLIGIPGVSKIHYTWDVSEDIWIGTSSTDRADNIVIEGMTFYSDYGIGVYATGVPWIYGIRGYFHNLIVRNCTFYNLRMEAINGHSGFTGNNGDECNVIIDGNYIHNIDREGIQYRDISGLRITNNRIEDVAGVGINTENDGESNISINHLYAHNVVSGGQQGIKASAIGGGRNENISFTDNIVYDSGYGINCAVDGAIVANNIVYNNSVQGIRLSSCNNVVVEGNVCFNNGTGIWLAGASVNNTILVNNICYDNQDAPVQKPVYKGTSITGELKYIGNRFNSYSSDSANVEDTDNVFASSSIYRARKFTASATGKITQIGVRLKQLGDPAGTFTASIYSDTPGLPSTLVGTASAAIDIDTLSTDGSILARVYFPTPPRVISGTTYWIVIIPSGYTYSAGVTELIWMSDADGGSSECAIYDGSWALTSATDGADFVVEYLADDFVAVQQLSFNTPKISIQTPNNSYRDILFQDGETIHGRLRYFRANAAPASDRLRVTIGQQTDCLAIDPTQIYLKGSSGLDGATPISLVLRSTDDGDWTPGSVMAKIDFSSADAGTGGAAGVRTSIRDVVEDTAGSDHGLAFWTTTDGLTGLKEQARIDNNGNLSVGTAAIATNATNGFLYIPSCAGTPTGVPTAKTGLVPMVYDSTNDILYIYRSGWKDVSP